MVKHFHGIASRISQRQVDARVSLLGMHQLYSAQMLTDPADRLFLARLLVEYLEQGGRQQASLETLEITATALGSSSVGCRLAAPRIDGV